MSELTYTVTIDGQPWSDDQLRRIEYERTLHVLHEFKNLGVDVKDGQMSLSHIDINWLDAERAKQISLDIRARLGEAGTAQVFKDVLADSERRWKQWASDYDPAAALTSETVIEAHGVGIQETVAALGVVADQRAALSTNPEHYIVVGGVESGQHEMEAFGMFGEPVFYHGAATEMPAGLPITKDPTAPFSLFGEVATMSDDTNIHVGALHQFHPTDDGFTGKSTFIAPGNTPAPIVEGHKLHFAIELVNSMKIAFARKQAA